MKKQRWNEVFDMVAEGAFEGVSLIVYHPHKDVRNPTWDELDDFAHLAYMTALSDVRDAIEGDYSQLEAALDENRVLLRDQDREALTEEFHRNEELIKQKEAELAELKATHANEDDA
jgi:hypothetical protein